MYYYLAITATTICDTTYFNDVTSEYCAEYNIKKDLTDDESLITIYLYFYQELMTPCLIAFAFLFVETSINITYYKDCVFALTCFFMFIGMYWVNHKYRGKSFKPLMSELYDGLTSNLFDRLQMNPESELSALMLSPTVQNDAKK